VRVVSEGLVGGERVGVGFFPRLSGVQRADEQVERAALFERDGVLDAQARLLLEDLPPGEWSAEVRVGGSYSRPFGYLLPCTIELQLAPGQHIERSVSTQRGGRARVLVSSATGARLSGTARLFDEAGREHPLHMIGLEPDAALEQSGRILLNAPSELGPLRAGNWRLELSALGHQPLALDFEVRESQIVELEARLTPL
jgi:hypothetical protein